MQSSASNPASAIPMCAFPSIKRTFIISTWVRVPPTTSRNSKFRTLKENEPQCTCVYTSSFESLCGKSHEVIWRLRFRVKFILLISIFNLITQQSFSLPTNNFDGWFDVFCAVLRFQNEHEDGNMRTPSINWNLALAMCVREPLLVRSSKLCIKEVAKIRAI